MATLTPDADIDPLRRRYVGAGTPAELRQSESRRDLLERWARTLCRQDLSLAFTDTPGETARVQLGRETPQVTIPSWEIPQQASDFRRKAYDMLMQRALTLHELGHVRYTDQDAVDAATAAVAENNRAHFHRLWNALEDAAIEEQLRREYAVSDELAVMNANFLQQGTPTGTYDLFDATQIACLNLGVYDTGSLSRLLDENDRAVTFESDSTRDTFESEILPAVRAVVADVTSTADPHSRTQRILDFWEQIQDHFDTADQPDSDPKGNHATQDNGHGNDASDLDSVRSSEVDRRSQQIIDGTNSQQGETQNADTVADSSQASSNSDDGDSAEESQSGREDSQSGRNAMESAASEEQPGATESGDSGDGGGTTDGGDEADAAAPEEDTDTTDEPSDGTRGENHRREDNDPDDHKDEPRDGHPVDDSDSPSLPSDGTAGGDQRNSPYEHGQQSNEDTAGPDSNRTRDADGLSESTGSPQGDRDSGDASGEETASSATDSVTDRGDDVTDATTDSDESSPDFNREAMPFGRIDNEDLEASLLGEVERQTQADEEGSERITDDLQAFQQVLSQFDNDRLTPVELELVDGDGQGGSDQVDRWREIQNDGAQLHRILDERLKQERRGQWRRGRPSGRIDSRSLPRTRVKDPRVFRQRDKPDKKDYAAVFVLDRSSSMSSKVAVAERATFSMAYALEELGVDVCILDMCGGPRLAKPFSASIEHQRDALLTGETVGSTPLTETLRLARERVEQQDKHPFLVAVTDGKPDNETTYREELKRTNFPVLGIYLATRSLDRSSVSDSLRDSARLYDRQRIVVDEAELLNELRGLCRDVMF